MEKGSKCREEKLDGTDLSQVIKANTSSEGSWGPRAPLILAMRGHWTSGVLIPQIPTPV